MTPLKPLTIRLRASAQNSSQENHRTNASSPSTSRSKSKPFSSSSTTVVASKSDECSWSLFFLLFFAFCSSSSRLLLFFMQFFSFNLFSFAVCVSALSKTKRKKNALLVFVKEEIKRELFFFFCARRTLSLSARTTTADTKNLSRERRERFCVARACINMCRERSQPFLISFLTSSSCWRDFYCLGFGKTALV